uniref:Uncharacterized protein AlNc14C241G9462 n=1 Tax=Albugo laibachii Nc14 TaxID=890382 RepID=F0WSX3_9STRA|nr:conserved hypothetical protein [Albugo laibachii Nc14]|eukprot:CCA24457.1 conserved hypothetical protein [Albugo laibachii Nc14]
MILEYKASIQHNWMQWRLQSNSAEEGSRVLSSLPFAKVLSVTYWQKRCSVCFQQLHCVSRCGACHIAHYCSKNCQKDDWRLDHRIECATFRQLATLRLHSDQISDLLLLGRVVRRIDGIEPLAKDGILPDKANATSVFPMDSMWHSVDLTNETHLISLLAQKLGLVRESWHVRDLQEMLARFQCNNFCILDENFFEVGAGCYPLGAMVNHSCDPNCVTIFARGSAQLELWAMKSIGKDEEVTISYVDPANCMNKRRKYLQKRYHFDCRCQRCYCKASHAATIDTFLVADENGIPSEKWSLNEATKRGTVLSQITGKIEEFRVCEKLTRKCAILADIDSDFVRNVFTHLHMYNIDAFRLQARLFSDLTIMIAESQSGNSREFAELEFVQQKALVYGYRISKFYAFVYPALHPLSNLHNIRMGELALLYTPNADTSADLKKILRREWLKNGKGGLEKIFGPKHNLAD